MKTSILSLTQILFFLLFLSPVVALSQKNDIEVWKIDAEKSTCEGATTIQCLLVKKQSQKSFELFHDEIKGFDYEEGFNYTIQVRKTLKTPPISIDESPYTFELVKIVSKKARKELKMKPIDNKKPYSSSDVSSLKTIVVNEERVPCDGNPDAKCLLIKFDNQKTFETFYQNIDGFTFEEGYRHTIQVRERHVPNPMVKQAMPVYTLIKVIKKTKIFDPVFIDTFAVSDGPTPLDKKWYLRKMKDTDTTSFIIDDNEVWLELNTTENKLSGKAPCNTYFAVFQSDVVSTFQALAVISTKMYCGNMTFEDLYFSLLQNADNFEIKDGRLVLYIGKRLLLEFE